VVVGTIWRTWPVWGSLALLVVLIAALLALVSEPQLLFNHIVSLIGQPPFVQ
jgi:hypothetical protein